MSASSRRTSEAPRRESSAETGIRASGVRAPSAETRAPWPPNAPSCGRRTRRSRAPGRAAFAERMIFRILAHPETQHDAVLRIVRRAWHEQQEPHVGRLSIRVGRSPGLPAISPACSRGNASVRFFLSSGFNFQISSLRRIHAGDDPAPECRCGTRAREIDRALQELGHRRGHRRMKEPLLRRTIVALGVAFLRRDPRHPCREATFHRWQTSFANRGVTRKPPLRKAVADAIDSGLTSEAPIAVVGYG